MTITDQFNFTKEVIKAFGDVPASYSDLIDLETSYAYNHIEVVNETDSDIVLKFANTETLAEWTVPALSASVRDWFMHNGIIQYKYVLAPTTGFFKLNSWLGGK